MPRSHEELDAWARDHELQHARDREERRLEDARLIDVVKKHVDGALRPLAEVPAKIDALVKQSENIARVNDKQLDILEASAEERGMRKQREATAAEKKTADELALAQAKLDAETKARAAADEIAKLGAKNQKWQIIAGVVTAIAVALITTYFAVHK